MSSECLLPYHIKYRACCIPHAFIECVNRSRCISWQFIGWLCLGTCTCMGCAIGIQESSLMLQSCRLHYKHSTLNVHLSMVLLCPMEYHNSLVHTCTHSFRTMNISKSQINSAWSKTYSTEPFMRCRWEDLGKSNVVTVITYHIGLQYIFI